jgi:hypothetical protein
MTQLTPEQLAEIAEKIRSQHEYRKQLCARLVPDGEDISKLDAKRTIADIDRLLSHIAALTAERDAATQRVALLDHSLGNVLARIHRDGGHYVQEHGVEKACEDADEIIVQLRTDLLAANARADARADGERDAAVKIVHQFRQMWHDSGAQERAKAAEAMAAAIERDEHRKEPGA